jgi:UPF0148 protein|tara:strand:+ start:174 stop:500 length:327 start_codon:yes stop_codon:yes gene_type:complete
MAKELTEKAIKMLLDGATLVSEPCPYCKGVRVIKDGFALCVNCGKQPEQKTTQTNSAEKEDVKPLKILEKKLEDLSKQLEKEVNPKKQQELIESINSLIDVISKLKLK